ncbi:MAG TPA: cytochrome c oxidase subunit 3 [Burkholderiales bacterium]
MMRETREGDQRVLDVSGLPTYAYSHRSLMWWGTLGMIAIEGTVFALAIVVYFYVRTRVNEWPPSVLPPELIWGTANTVLMLASLIPNQCAKNAAEAEDLPKVRISLAVCLFFGIGFLALRALEFTALNCRWDTNAYGSALWMLLGLHTVHVVTDVYDTAVLAALMAFGPIEGKRFVDVSENAFYWYFVVLAWIPIYAIVYFGARVL